MHPLNQMSFHDRSTTSFLSLTCCASSINSNREELFCILSSAQTSSFSPFLKALVRISSAAPLIVVKMASKLSQYSATVVVCFKAIRCSYSSLCCEGWKRAMSSIFMSPQDCHGCLIFIHRDQLSALPLRHTTTASNFSLLTLLTLKYHLTWNTQPNGSSPAKIGRSNLQNLSPPSNTLLFSPPLSVAVCEGV